MKKIKRCDWVDLNNQLYVDYHDTEWGVPVHDDKLHFEMLILEGAQAGLNWATVLAKREGYKKAFCNFNASKVAKLSTLELEKLRENPNIIRNRLKILSAKKNAIAFLQIQKEFKSFDNYIWGFVDGKQIKNKFKTLKEVPAQTTLSESISKDLKKRGMSFVGPTIIYAYLQAIGIVNDHTTTCWRYKNCKQ